MQNVLRPEQIVEIFLWVQAECKRGVPTLCYSLSYIHTRIETAPLLVSSYERAYLVEHIIV